MKRLRFLALFLSAVILLSGCEKPKERFSAVELNFFDTATTLLAYCESQAEFEEIRTLVFSELEKYHKLYDVYNSYDGINNIKTINDNAGVAPVKVEDELFEMIEFSKKAYAITNGKTNVALGAVLKIWHNYRDKGVNSPDTAKIPTEDELFSASQHCNIDDVVLDYENKTVFLKDPLMSLDVGATAKGFAAQKICELLREKGAESVAISVGGNVCTIGTKPDGSPWSIGIQDPFDYNGTVVSTKLSDVCLVTSGDYQRYYIADGVKYHHIIDSDTLFPANYFSSVSVICTDSALADALSTALFSMPYSEGKKLVESLENVEVMWITPDAQILITPGFDRYTQEVSQ